MDTTMKRDRAIYWATTGMVLLVMAYSIITFTFFDRALYPEGAFVHLQLPNYFISNLHSAVPEGRSGRFRPLTS